MALSSVALQAFECDGRAGGIAGELQDTVCVIGLEPDGVVDVESGVRPFEHGTGVAFGERSSLADEGAEQRAPEGVPPRARQLNSTCR